MLPAQRKIKVLARMASNVGIKKTHSFNNSNNNIGPIFENSFHISGIDWSLISQAAAEG
jgi:hypothetical protein